MREKTVKGNIVCIIILLLGIVVLLICGRIFKNKIKQDILGAIIFCVICGIIITIINLVRKYNFNRSQRLLPYGFDYNAEFIVYKNIGKTKTKKAVKALKPDIQIPNVYTDWRTQLKHRNQEIIDDENFYHYLIRYLRNAKTMCEVSTSVLVPVEIALMTVTITSFGGNMDKMIGIIVSAIMIGIMLTCALYMFNEERDFISDIINILCPNISDKKEINGR